MNTPATPWQPATLQHVVQALPGNHLPWLRQARQEALECCMERGLPTTRDEEWKYTDVSAIGRRTSLAPERGRARQAAQAVMRAWAVPIRNAHRMVFVNGHYVPGLSKVGELPDGVRLESLAHELDNAPAMLKPFFSHVSAPTVFSCLNTAVATDGTVLHLAPDVTLDRPLYLLFIATGEEGAIYPRNIIVAEEGACATVIEHYAGAADAHNFTDAVTQIGLGCEVTLDHYKLVQEGDAAFHIGGIHATQAGGSRFSSHSFVLGGRLCRNDITTLLAEHGSECLFNGLYLGGGRQHVDHHTRIEHAAPECISREYYRGVLDDAARGVFNGKVIVRPGAAKTDAHQANHNLLLSRQAEVDTKPQLEIFAADVKCTHGATVGQLDDDMLFYLRSRGIDAQLAKAMLIHGFAHDIIDRVELPELRARLEHALLARLPQGDSIKELL